MSEKLSERLERFEFSDELGNGDFSIILEAAAIARAVEDAPVAMTSAVIGDCEIIGMDLVYDDSGANNACKLHSLDGKRVKLVEVE